MLSASLTWISSSLFGYSNWSGHSTNSHSERWNHLWERPHGSHHPWHTHLCQKVMLQSLGSPHLESSYSSFKGSAEMPSLLARLSHWAPRHSGSLQPAQGLAGLCMPSGLFCHFPSELLPPYDPIGGVSASLMRLSASWGQRPASSITVSELGRCSGWVCLLVGN